jgi:hypothetical protein
MAFPVILIDSATGSDSLASGAGPSTALTGTAAATDGAGTTVTLDGSPSLSGVATDGSHVIYLADSTAGARNFGKITAKDDTAKTVTVSNAFGLSLSGKSWAIGGVRASVAGANSVKLFNNNNSSGDAMPGWVVELQSGHAETISSSNAIRMRRAGDTTSGRVVLRGATGAATRPRIDISATGGNIILFDAVLNELSDFDIRYTGGSTGSAVHVYCNGATDCAVNKIRFYGSTHKTGTCIYLGGGSLRVTNCELSDCATGIGTGGGGGSMFENLWVHDCSGDGIVLDSNGGEVYNCILGPNITGDGIVLDWSGSQFRRSSIRKCTILAGGDGIQITASPSSAATNVALDNIYIHSAGGYGFNFGSLTLAQLQAYGVKVRNCGFGSVTSGTINSGLSSVLENCVTSATVDNASFATGGDFTIGAASTLKGVGYPSAVMGLNSTTRSYVDVGAAQRQETGGAAGMLYTGDMSGGFG